MTDPRALDEALRSRLTEIFAAAGVDQGRASLELMYLLPWDFVQAYSELFHQALKLDSGGGGNDGVEKAGSGGSRYKGERPMVTGGGKHYKNFWTIRDDERLKLKARIDKRLRAIAREIRDGGVEDKVRCSRCGRIMRRDDNFCSGCGNHRPVGGE